MRRTILLCTLAVLLLGAARAEESEDVDESAVVVLTDKNYDDKMKSAKFALIEFYAPWCGHCKALKPEWAKAAKSLADYSKDVMIAKLDATEEKEVAAKFDIQGYPSIKWFIDGKEVADYSGGRTADEITRWVKKKTGPATTEVADAAALAAARKENKVVVLAFFDKYEGDAHAAYEAAAQKSDDAAFLKTTSKEVAAKLGISGKATPAFAVGRNYDDFGEEAVQGAGHPAFEEKDLEKALEAFVTAEKLPAFLEFTQETSQTIFGSGISSQIIITAPGDDFKPGAKLHKALVAAASKLKGKIVMVIAKTESDNGKPIIDYFGLDKTKKEPQVVGFDSGAGKKYLFEGKATSGADLEKFGLAVAEGTAKKFFKSAETPKEPLDNGVAIVTGNTVESIVHDAKRDVFLEVYAPWCGHCKALTPTYEKLAKRFAKIDSVVIAKMDGTENEHPTIEAQGFPTLLFFPAEEGAEAIPYEGGRTLGEMTKFIKKHAKVAFELPKKKKSDKKEEAKEEEEKRDEL